MTLAIIQAWAWWLLLFFGMAICFGLLAKNLRSWLGMPKARIVGFVTALTAAILVGGRASWVVRFWPYYSERGWGEILSFWHGGIDSSGSIYLALSVFILFCGKYGYRFGQIGDAGVVGAGWLIGIGRIGCFIEGDDWGKPTDSFLGVIFEPHQVAFKEQVAMGMISKNAEHSLAVHPTQLYLSGLGFLLVVVFGVLLRKRELPEGMRIGLFMLIYGVGRFVIEFLRADVSRGMVLGLSVPQWTMFLLTCGGFWLTLSTLRKRSEQWVPRDR